jgi:hypothetical protein
MSDGPMWRFLKRRRVRNKGTLVLGIRTVLMRLVMKSHNLLTNFTALVQQQTQKVRPYNGSYLLMSFIWTGDSNYPIPLRLVCGKRLTNAALATVKLKRRLTTNHSDITSNRAEYFKRLLESQNKQSLSVPICSKIFNLINSPYIPSIYISV